MVYVGLIVLICSISFIAGALYGYSVACKDAEENAKEAENMRMAYWN